MHTRRNECHRLTFPLTYAGGGSVDTTLASQAASRYCACQRGSPGLVRPFLSGCTPSMCAKRFAVAMTNSRCVSSFGSYWTTCRRKRDSAQAGFGASGIRRKRDYAQAGFAISGIRSKRDWSAQAGLGASGIRRKRDSARAGFGASEVPLGTCGDPTKTARPLWS